MRDEPEQTMAWVSGLEIGLVACAVPVTLGAAVGGVEGPAENGFRGSSLQSGWTTGAARAC